MDSGTYETMGRLLRTAEGMEAMAAALDDPYSGSAAGAVAIGSLRIAARDSLMLAAKVLEYESLRDERRAQSRKGKRYEPQDNRTHSAIPRGGEAPDSGGADDGTG